MHSDTLERCETIREFINGNFKGALTPPTVRHWFQGQEYANSTVLLESKALVTKL